MALLMARSATVALLVAAVIRACVASTGIEVGLRQYGGRTVAEAGTGFLNTAVFEAAVAAIEEAGSGRLTVPPGEWLTTGFALTSNMVLFLERGATITALSNFTCTNSSSGSGSSPPSCDAHCMFKGAKCCGVPCVPCATTGRRCSADHWRPRNDSCLSYPAAVKPGDAGSTSGVDERNSGYEPLIGAWNASNITVTGDNGTIDGGGPAWWPIRAELVHGRPHLLFFSRSSHIRVSNLTLRSSPFWTVRFWDSGPALTASNLTVLATCASENNDGVDIDSSHDALVENLYYDGCDDGVALKSGRTDGKTNAGRAFAVPTRDVIIRNVVAKTRSACIAIGSECEGGIHNISLRGLRCRESWDGVRFKTPKGEMIVSDLAFEDVHLEHVGLHYPNTSGWPGAGISCANAANVSFSK